VQGGTLSCGEVAAFGTTLRRTDVCNAAFVQNPSVIMARELLAAAKAGGDVRAALKSATLGQYNQHKPSGMSAKELDSRQAEAVKQRTSAETTRRGDSRRNQTIAAWRALSKADRKLALAKVGFPPSMINWVIDGYTVTPHY
jgi:hypothetical protein